MFAPENGGDVNVGEVCDPEALPFGREFGKRHRSMHDVGHARPFDDPDEGEARRSGEKRERRAAAPRHAPHVLPREAPHDPAGEERNVAQKRDDRKKRQNARVKIHPDPGPARRIRSDEAAPEGFREHRVGRPRKDENGQERLAPKGKTRGPHEAQEEIERYREEKERKAQNRGRWRVHARGSGKEESDGISIVAKTKRQTAVRFCNKGF